MPDTFQEEVRRALRSRANQTPSAAADRLAAADYRPVRWGTGRRMAVVAGVAGVVGAGIGLATATAGGGSGATAFASYSTTPTVPSAGQVPTADATCVHDGERWSRRTATSAPGALGPLPGFPGGAASVAAAAAGRWRAVVHDVRGPYTLVIVTADVSTGKLMGDCLLGPGVTGAAVFSVTWVDASPAAAGGIESLSGGVPGGAGQPVVAAGGVGTSVTAVTLVLSDGHRVTATVADGFYAAWWPYDATVTAATVTTSAGTTAHRFPVGDPILRSASETRP